MKFLNKQIHFIASLNRKLLAGFIVGFFLSFIIIFLEPFGTNDYVSEYRTLALSGFGACLFVTFIIHSIIENSWYNKRNKVWLVSHEICSILIFFTIAGTVIYLYNHIVVNGGVYSIKTHLGYFRYTISVMIPVIAPLLLFLRQKFGERILPIPPDTIHISGENKDETLELKKNAILFIKSVENYIEISFISEDGHLLSKTFRQTLSNAHCQLSFLEKSHRSYLVNIDNVKEIEGNSQSAKISFLQTDKKIPLSKTLFKSLKSKLA